MAKLSQAQKDAVIAEVTTALDAFDIPSTIGSGTEAPPVVVAALLRRSRGWKVRVKPNYVGWAVVKEQGVAPKRVGPTERAAKGI